MTDLTIFAEKALPAVVMHGLNGRKARFNGITFEEIV